MLRISDAKFIAEKRKRSTFRVNSKTQRSGLIEKRYALPRALFRIGGRCRPEVLIHAAAAVGLSDPYVRNPIRVARQRYDLSDANAAGGCGRPSR